MSLKSYLITFISQIARTDRENSAEDPENSRRHLTEADMPYQGFNLAITSHNKWKIIQQQRNTGKQNNETLLWTKVTSDSSLKHSACHLSPSMVFCHHKFWTAGRPINLCFSQSHDLNILGTQIKLHKIHPTDDSYNHQLPDHKRIKVAKTKIHSGKEDMITYRIPQLQLQVILENVLNTSK